MIVPGNTIKLVDVGTSNAAVPEVQSQSPVVKAVRNIKKKNAGAYIRLQPTTSQTDKTNTQKESGNATSGRGVVYISHIPDGFYEDEMRQYFAQFGRVTRVKLARSRKTGRSRGYAFIEFQYAEVAKVVAETMNNYLLQNRLLKASYVDKQYPAEFWNQQACGPQNCPLARNRRIEIKRKNAVLNAAKELAQQGKRRRQLAKTLNRLRDAGVDYTLQVKDQVELTTGAEKKGKKFGGASNTKQEKETSQESVKVEEEATKVQPEKKGRKSGGAKNTKREKQMSQESVVMEEEPPKAQPVLLVDESDDEIEFSVPSFVIRKTLKRQSSSPSDKVSPKVKRGKRSRSGSLTPKVMSPSCENLSSPQNQNGEVVSGSNHETRKSGRVSVIPKHISSGFHVTLSPKKSPGKENRENQLSEQSNTPKVVSTASPKLQKSVEHSTNKKSKNTKLSTANKIEQSLESSKMSPEVRRRNSETSDSVAPSPATDSVVKKASPKANKNTALTPKQMKNNTLSANKRKTPKSEIQDSDEMKMPVASQPETAVLPKSSKKTPATNAPPNQLSPIQKPSSSDRKAKMQKTPLKTPMGRKSLPSSKQSNLTQKSNSEDKPVGLKTPLKTPVGRKSQNWTTESSPKGSPLSHSTALKRNSTTPKASKPTRKSLKLNK